MSFYVELMIYCIKKYKSIQRAVEIFQEKYPHHRSPKLKDVLQIYYRQIYFESATSKKCDRKRDNLIAVCFDESSGTYGDIIEKLVVWFKLHKFFIINSLLRTKRLKNVDMNTWHEAVLVNTPRSKVINNDDNSECTDISEDSDISMDWKSDSRSGAQKKNRRLPRNALDPYRVPSVYTTRLEDMSRLPELSIKKFLKQTEIKSKPYYNLKVHKRNKKEEKIRITEKPRKEISVIYDINDNDKINGIIKQGEKAEQNNITETRRDKSVEIVDEDDNNTTNTLIRKDKRQKRDSVTDKSCEEKAEQNNITETRRDKSVEIVDEDDNNTTNTLIRKDKRDSVTDKSGEKYVIIDDDSDENPNRVQINTKQRTIPTIDLCSRKNNTQFKNCFSIPTLKNITKGRIIDRDIDIVFHDIRRNNVELFCIDQIGKIIDYSAINIDKSENLKDVLQKKCGLPYEKAFVVNVCCWFYRKSLVKSLWPTIENTLKLLNPIHYCRFGRCNCCCRKRRVALTVPNVKNNPKCLFCPNGKDCNETSSLHISPLVLKSTYYKGNRFKEKYMLQSFSTINNSQPCKLTKVILNNVIDNDEGRTNGVSLNKEVYDVNSVGDIVNEDILNLKSMEEETSVTQSEIYLKSCCMLMRKRNIKQLCKYNMSTGSINYLNNVKQSAIHLPNICEKCRKDNIRNKSQFMFEDPIKRKHIMIEHSKICHEPKDLRKRRSKLDEDDNVYFVAKRSEIIESSSVVSDSDESSLNDAADHFPTDEYISENISIHLNDETPSKPFKLPKNYMSDVLPSTSNALTDSNAPSTSNTTTLLNSTFTDETVESISNDQSDENNVKHILLKLNKIPILMDKIINALEKFVTAKTATKNQINVFFCRFEDISLTVEDNGKIIASMPQPTSISQDEMPLLQTMLQQIQAYVTSLNMKPLNDNTTSMIDSTGSVWSCINGYYVNYSEPSLVSASSSESTTKYDDFEKWMGKQNEMFSKQFFTYSREYESSDNVSLPLPKICEVFSLSNIIPVNKKSEFSHANAKSKSSQANEMLNVISHANQKTRTNVRVAVHRPCNINEISQDLNPIDLEEEISYNTIIKTPQFDFERGPNTSINHNNVQPTSDNSRKRKLEHLNVDLPVIIID